MRGQNHYCQHEALLHMPLLLNWQFIPHIPYVPYKRYCVEMVKRRIDTCNPPFSAKYDGLVS